MVDSCRRVIRSFRPVIRWFQPVIRSFQLVIRLFPPVVRSLRVMIHSFPPVIQPVRHDSDRVQSVAAHFRGLLLAYSAFPREHERTAVAYSAPARPDNDDPRVDRTITVQDGVIPVKNRTADRIVLGARFLVLGPSLVLGALVRS